MDLETVRNAIERWDRLDINVASAYDESVSILRSIGKLPVLLDVMKDDTRICRTRTHWDDVLFKEIQEISTPQPHHVTSFGRCNIPGQPIFYASLDRPTSYAELIDSWIKNGEHGSIVYATIGAWRTKRAISHIVIASPDEADRTTEFDIYYGKILDQEIAKVEKSIGAAYSEFYRYLYKMFSANAKNDKHPYLVTSAYSNMALDLCGKKADGVLYPSVPYQGKGLNLALRSEFITEDNIYLKFVNRDRFQRKDDSTNAPDFRQLEFVEASKIDYTQGTIEWLNKKTIVRAAE